MRTAEEIHRDIARERADLSDTLHSLSDSLSFESMTDILSDQVRDLGSDVIDDLAGAMIERARQKPLAAGLVLAGLAWMALGAPEKRGSTARHHPGYTHPPQGPARSRPALDDRISRLANDARILRDRVAEGTENLSNDARDRVVKARTVAAEAAEQAVQAMRSGAVRAKDVVQDNPFAVGGIALAIGATIGGALMLRKKETEDREKRNALFSEADRIMKEELERSGPVGKTVAEV